MIRKITTLIALSAITFGMSAAGDDPGKPTTHTLAVAYALDTCPISGKKLTDKAVVNSYDDREVRFCCDACPAKFEADKEAQLKKIDDKIIKQQLAYYPTSTCVISGEALGSMGEPVNYVWRNRLVRLCCKGCESELNDNPEALMQKLDKAIIEQQSKDYPLKTCPVSDEELGSMGEPVNVIVANRLVKLCCEQCTIKLHAEPAKYLAKIEQAWKQKGSTKPAAPESASAPKSN